MMDETYINALRSQAAEAALALVEAAKLREGHLVVVGCSSSEIVGEHIGKGSSLEAAEAVYEGIRGVFEPRGIRLAAQCCEHLNRALILERDSAAGIDEVNVVPQVKAGGSFATTAYRRMRDPVAVEHIRADAGLDIGMTLIGMHLKEVAVPLRLPVKKIGEAPLSAGRSRPKCIGGSRAVYDESLL